MNRQPAVHVRTALLAVAFATALGTSGCKRGQPVDADPETVFELVDALLDQGEIEQARRLLFSNGLQDTEQGIRYRAEAAIMTGAFDDALIMLTQQVELDEQTQTLLFDACAMGAVAAFDDDDAATARRRFMPCERGPRIDLKAIQFRLQPTAPTDEAARGLLDALKSAEPGPELDLAAAMIERRFVELAEAARASDDLEQIRLLWHAFAVGQDSEIGEALVAALSAASEARAESDPQAAASLMEQILIPRVAGLQLSEEVAAHAARRSRQILFPIYIDNFRERYDRKRAPGDIQSGKYSREADIFSVGMIDTPERYEAFLNWFFYATERPRAVPTPDILGHVDACADRSVPCTFTFEQFAAMSYDMREMEMEYLAANPGVSFEWVGP